MAKIYTRHGDDGMTTLIGGVKVKKTHPRIEAYGTVDELSAQLGKLASYMKDGENKSLIIRIQRNLFTLCSYLATDKEQTQIAKSFTLDEEEVRVLEEQIDYLNICIPPQTAFILPGGIPESAQAHVCRTVCRRAERRIFSLHEISPLDPWVMQYMNRLSDYLFMLARKLNFHEGVREETWTPKK